MQHVNRLLEIWHIMVEAFLIKTFYLRFQCIRRRSLNSFSFIRSHIERYFFHRSLLSGQSMLVSIRPLLPVDVSLLRDKNLADWIGSANIEPSTCDWATCLLCLSSVPPPPVCTREIPNQHEGSMRANRTETTKRIVHKHTTTIFINLAGFQNEKSENYNQTAYGL